MIGGAGVGGWRKKAQDNKFRAWPLLQWAKLDLWPRSATTNNPGQSLKI